MTQPHHNPIEFCWDLPVVRQPTRASVQSAEQAEACGFDAVLVSTLHRAADPWVLSTLISQATLDLRCLIAINTSHVLPTYARKALNTLREHFGPRFDVNVVTGSLPMELARDATPQGRELRYQRTAEFVELLTLLRQNQVRFQGNHFQVENTDVFPPFGEDQMGERVFVAGSSAEAMGIADRFAEGHLFYALPPEQCIPLLENRVRGGAKPFRQGMMIDVISRPTAEEAWEAAHRVLAKYSMVERKMVQMFVRSSDSHGIQSRRNFNLQDSVEHATLWDGLAQVSKGVALSVVGSHEQVASTFKRYIELGIGHFVVSCFADQGDPRNFGEHVLPLIRPS